MHEVVPYKGVLSHSSCKTWSYYTTIQADVLIQVGALNEVVRYLLISPPTILWASVILFRTDLRIEIRIHCKAGGCRGDHAEQLTSTSLWLTWRTTEGGTSTRWGACSLIGKPSVYTISTIQHMWKRMLHPHQSHSPLFPGQILPNCPKEYLNIAKLDYWILQKNINCQMGPMDCPKEY